MAEIEEAFRVKVSEVCRFYCLQVWNEALDQAGVEASSTFKRAENVCYPLAIRASGSLGSKADLVSKKANEGKESPSKALPTTNISPRQQSNLRMLKMQQTPPKKWLVMPPYL